MRKHLKRTSVDFSKQPLLWLFCNAERSKRTCPAFAVTVATVALTVAENSRIAGKGIEKKEDGKGRGKGHTCTDKEKTTINYPKGEEHNEKNCENE